MGDRIFDNLSESHIKIIKNMRKLFIISIVLTVISFMQLIVASQKHLNLVEIPDRKSVV